MVKSTMICLHPECVNSGTWYCSKCKVVMYCSRRCQEQHCWVDKKSCAVHVIGIFDFLGLPREIRDMIYEELLVIHLSKSDQIEYDCAMSTIHENEVYKEMVLRPFKQKMSIMPGHRSFTKYAQPFIFSAKGVLLANKQIHEEACTVLFSKNTFMLVIVSHLKRYFWDCGRPLCSETSSHCYVSQKNLDQIKHLRLEVYGGDSPSDDGNEIYLGHLTHNLEQFVQIFNTSQVSFQDLTIKYQSQCHPHAALRMEDLEQLLQSRRHEPQGDVSVPVVSMETILGEWCDIYDDNVEEFFRPAYEVSKAILQLNRPIANLQVLGDFPSFLAAQMRHNFETKRSFSSSITGSHTDDLVPDT